MERYKKRDDIQVASFNEMASDGSGLSHLCFVVDETLISRFLLLLQRGFIIKAHVGCNVRIFLLEEIGLNSATIETIQSVILNGKPVDDLDSAIIRDGSSLALSAAVPGLVGATLRRGGKYSSFRRTITYEETGLRCSTSEGFVRMKLFNLLLDSLGRDFLRKGIYLSTADFKDFLADQPSDFWLGCRDVFLNGKAVGLEALESVVRLPLSVQLMLSVNVPHGDV
ncbi:MAG: hypothetical protein ACLPX5_05780 [Dissulfurispiraceae bacterium]